MGLMLPSQSESIHVRCGQQQDERYKKHLREHRCKREIVVVRPKSVRACVHSLAVGSVKDAEMNQPKVQHGELSSMR